MRIISQDGKWDLPYDKIVIDKSCKKIFAQSNLISSGDDNYVEIAVYSTSEKCEKAMEMLREKCMGFESSKVFYNALFGLSAIKDVEEGVIISSLNQIISTIFFRFPQDSEIEV